MSLFKAMIKTYFGGKADLISLADRLVSGGAPATAEELLDLLQNAPREELREAAHRVTVAFAPRHFDFCSIVNAVS